MREAPTTNCACSEACRVQPTGVGARSNASDEPRTFARVVCVVRVACLLLITLAATSLRAQLPIANNLDDRVAAGGDVEQYLRALQVAGLAPLQPWSIRPFAPGQLDRLISTDSAHPWSGYLKKPTKSDGELYLISPKLQTMYNTTYPYGFNDGPIWAGRGLTTAVDFGFGGRYGPLSFVIAPEAFRAENQGFGLQPIVIPERGEVEGLFSDPFSPASIDQPQRFGTKAYQRLDPGQSTIRLDVWHLTAGVGSEDQFWGPAVSNPILLGNNAAGFRHAFAGVRRLNLGVARVDANVVWGRLDQSFLMPDVEGTRKRFMSGLVATATINGLPGLEVGFARFFETIWPDSGLTRDDYLRPFNAFFKATRAQQVGGTGDEPDNQLASIFARWAFPRAGVEVYGEFGREDYNADEQDLIGEPDHDASYMVGMQRVWKRGKTALVAVRGEVLNTRMTSLNIVRQQTPFYEHTPVIQGFTQNGQVLGSYGAHGGGASNLSVDWYRPDGKWTFEWSRIALGEVLATGPSGAQAVGSLAEVTHALSAERLLFLDRYALTLGVDEVFKLNQSFNGVLANTRLRAALQIR
jgi:hypothetical protein